jgi:hypothetical protein
MKTTSNGRQPQNIRWNISAIAYWTILKFKTYVTKPYFVNPSNEDDFQGKTTSKFKSGISQQPLVGC